MCLVPVTTVSSVLCHNCFTNTRFLLPRSPLCVSVDAVKHCIMHHKGDDFQPRLRVWSWSQDIRQEFKPPFQFYKHLVTSFDSISFLRHQCISLAQCVPDSSLSVFQQHSGLGLLCSQPWISRTLIRKDQKLWGQCSWLPLTFAPGQEPLLGQPLMRKK